MGVGVGNSLLQVAEDVKRLQVPLKNISSNKATFISLPPGESRAWETSLPLVPSHEPRHRAVERLRKNSCGRWGGSEAKGEYMRRSCYR